MEISVGTRLSASNSTSRRYSVVSVFSNVQSFVLGYALVEKNELSHRTHIGELERQFRESESKFLELQQRLDSLQSKLFTLQTDRDPNTPVSKLQEQVTRNSQ